MIKIAVLEPMSFSHGPPNGIHNLIRGLVNKSEGVQWVLFDESGQREDPPAVGGIFSNKTIPTKCESKPDSRNPFRIPKSFRFTLHFLLRRNEIDVDLIHAHRVELGLLAMCLYPNIPLHLFIHNSASDLRSLRKSSSFWRFIPLAHVIVTRFVYKRAARILTFNKSEFYRASRRSTNVVQVQTFFDSVAFFPNVIPLLSESPPRSNELKIAWLGRLEREKNPELALRIIKDCVEKNLDVCLKVVGYGSLQNKLELFVNEHNLGDFIKFYGKLEPNQVGDVLRSCNAFLQTSKYEGSPTSVIEALACGIPVITTKSGDPDGIVLDRVNGFVVKTLAPSDFIEPILSSPKLSSISCVKSVESRSRENMNLNMFSI